MSAVYDTDVSHVYDLLYRGRGQDFAADARTLVDLAATRGTAFPTSALDVACGTGEHLRHLRGFVGDVAGLEASAAMCGIATAKLHGAPVVTGDMRSFDLGRTFDLVCCLTSSVGYMTGPGELAAALRAMARHVSPGGVLVLDPYWTPETFLDGYVGHEVVREGQRVVVRLSTSHRAGRHVTHHAEYLISNDAAIRHAVHEQSLTLFTDEEYREALRRAGCTAEHVSVSGGFAARGLFVGRPRRNAGEELGPSGGRASEGPDRGAPRGTP